MRPNLVYDSRNSAWGEMKTEAVQGPGQGETADGAKLDSRRIEL